MAAKKTSYIDEQGNKQIGYIIDGNTYTDETGTNPVGKGSVVEAGGQQWVKGVGENGQSMLYSDFLKQQGMNVTDYTDPNGQQKTGYIKNGITYADILGQSEVGKGSIVNAGGQQYIKGVGEGGQSMLYADYLAAQEPKETTYVAPDGSYQTGYIINGQTYKDKAGTTPIDPGSMVQAGGQTWVKGEDGKGMLYSDYLAQLEQQNVETVSDTSALEQMLADAQSAYQQAIAANDTVYAAQLQQQMNNIQAQIEKLNAGYKDLNTQLYRDYMMSRKNMPQVLAAQGITGGLSESTLLGLETGYQGNLAANERERLSGIKDIELSGSDAELQLAIEKAKADAAAGDTLAERRLVILQAIQDQRNYDQQRADEQANTAYERAQYNNQLLYANVLQQAETLRAYGDFSGYKAAGYTDAQIAAMQAAYDKEQAAIQAAQDREQAAYEKEQADADFQLQLDAAETYGKNTGDWSYYYELCGLEAPTQSYTPVYAPVADPGTPTVELGSQAQAIIKQFERVDAGLASESGVLGKLLAMNEAGLVSDAEMEYIGALRGIE